MNHYQKSVDELKLDENAKRRIFHRVRKEWDASREYRLKFERMRTANICLSIFLAIFCISNVAMAVVRLDSKPHYVISNDYDPKYFRIGETFSCTDEFHKDVGPNIWGGAIFNGSFAFESLSVAKSIQSGDTVYESAKDYFLIVKNTLDLDEFILDDYLNYIQFQTIFSQKKEAENTFLDRQKGTYVNSPGETIGCLNLEVTKALSCDFAMEDGMERLIREARGTLYLCLDIDREFYDFLEYYHIIETKGIEEVEDMAVPSLIQKDGIKTFGEVVGCYEKEANETEEELTERDLCLKYGGFEYFPGIMYGHVFKEADGKMYDRKCWYYGNYSDIAFYDTYVIE